MTNLYYNGPMKLHYNKDGADGLHWCVGHELGQWEVAVVKILCTKPITSVFQRKETPDDEDGHPSAWFAVDGKLTVDENGIAIIN